MPQESLKFPISFTMIVRNCGPAAAEALRSVRPLLSHPDDEVIVIDTGSTDDTVSVVMRESGLGTRLRVIERPDLTDAGMVERMRSLRPREFERFGGHAQFVGGCVSDFAAARQVSLDAAHNPVVAWLDADDVLEGDLVVLRKEIEDFFGKGGECMFLRYDYSHDGDDGQCTTALWRERFVLRTRHRWVGRCHEVLLPIEGFQGALARSETAWIRHVAGHRKQHEFSDLRNYAILKPIVDSVSDTTRVDPRVLYYLGNACRGLGDVREAEWCYRHFLPCSGSRDDRVLALLHLGQMYAMVGRSWKALRYYQEASLVHPDDPRTDFGLQRCHYDLGQWALSIRTGNAGLAKVGRFGTLNSYDPMQLTSFPHYFVACAAREMNDVETAETATRRFLATRPDLPAARDFAQQMAMWAAGAKQCAAIHQVLRSAVSVPFKTQILQGLNLPPMSALFGLMRPEDDVHATGGRPVSIYCGETAEAWGHDGGAMGIGGSERMVVEMARRLARRDLAVSVYCKLPSPAHRGLHDGVMWRHHLELNPTLPHGDLVVWRQVGALGMPVPAERRYLWCHDITPDAAFTPVVKAVMDRALFLSPWHRAVAAGLPDDKVYVTRNGVDCGAIAALGAPERNPRRVVYASSPDRGLHVLLRAWGLLAESDRLPADAELDILYGFTPFYVKMASRSEYLSIGGVQRHRFDYMEEILDAADRLPRVKMRGRVSKDEVLKTFLSSGVLCYPATFDETFCIAAAEAQACGCAVIAPRRAALTTTLWPEWHALEETTPEAVAVALERYFASVPFESERAVWTDWARKAFDLDALADEWKRDLFGEVANV